MSEQIFRNVWFLPEENKWSDLSLLAFRDSGTLIIRDDSLEFQGKKGRVVINVTAILNVSLGPQGRDFINNWVEVRYGSLPMPLTAFFADGNWLGWGGVLGGTERIFDAIRKVYIVYAEDQYEKSRLQFGISAGLICPSCHLEVPSNTKFCPRDGTPIGKLCQSCNAVNLPTASFCTNCGKVL